LSSELLSDRRCRMFPFHILSFAFWSVMVEPHLVPSNNVPQGSVTSFTTAVQKVLADCPTVVLALSCELFWKPSQSWMIP
jgi:hypothetical protein